MVAFHPLILAFLDFEIAKDVFPRFSEDVGFDGAQNFLCSAYREMDAIVKIRLGQIDMFQRDEVSPGVGGAAANFCSQEAWFVVVGAVGNDAGRRIY